LRNVRLVTQGYLQETVKNMKCSSGWVLYRRSMFVESVLSAVPALCLRSTTSRHVFDLPTNHQNLNAGSDLEY